MAPSKRFVVTSCFGDMLTGTVPTQFSHIKQEKVALALLANNAPTHRCPISGSRYTFTHSTSCTCSAMSPVAYSASFVGLLPVIGSPEAVNKRMMLTSAVATEEQDTYPLHVSYYAGVEPRAAQDEDMVLASGSLKVTFSNGVVTLFSDASTMNVVVASKHVSKGVVDPASDATCIISTTGICLHIEPGDRGLSLQTGAWNSEVCPFTLILRINFRRSNNHFIQAIYHSKMDLHLAVP
jgi:hypothetical protein